MNILSLNAGSSSLKYKLFSIAANGAEPPSQQLMLEGSEDHAGRDEMVKAADSVVDKCRPFGVDGVGYRVVHGGSTFVQPTLMTPKRLASLRALEMLDPLHNPSETAMIEAGFRQLPDVPAVAVFDTAFHSTLPETAWRYALPRDLADRMQVRRYGFHGISYSYVSQELLRLQGRQCPGSKQIICHLGNGASICAVQDGKSIDTSMGMTPLEGLVMGTRSGDLDPGLILYLLKAGRMTVDGLDYLLNHQSGLLGLSGRSGDVRVLEKVVSGGDALAEEALEIFAYRISKYVGAYAAALEGFDTLAFAGGVGEHSAELRHRICRRLSFLGVVLDDDTNTSARGTEPASVGASGGPVEVWVIPTNEELEVARQTYALLADAK